MHRVTSRPGSLYLVALRSRYFIAEHRQISQQKRVEFLHLFRYPFLPALRLFRYTLETSPTFPMLLL